MYCLSMVGDWICVPTDPGWANLFIMELRFGVVLFERLSWEWDFIRVGIVRVVIGICTGERIGAKRVIEARQKDTILKVEIFRSDCVGLTRK